MQAMQVHSLQMRSQVQQQQQQQQGIRPEHHIHGLHSHQMDSGPPPSASHLSAAPGMVDHQASISGGGSSMEHHSDGMITTANTASPPVHIQNLLLNQHQQQSTSGGTSSKGSSGGIIAGGNSMLMSHQSSANPHHPGIHSSAMGTGTLLIPHNDFHVPILPPMQATTPTSQNHSFFL